MDVWQGARQLVSLVASAAWLDPPASLLFVAGNVVVSDDLEGNLLIGNPTGDAAKDFTPPFARVHCMGADLDPDSPGRYSVVRYRIWVTAGSGGIAGTPAPAGVAANDSHGINQETGALRDPVQGQGKSTGRSVDELVGRVLEVLGLTNLPGQLVDSVHGLQGEVVALGARVNVDGSNIVARSIDLEVYNSTVSRTYHWPFAAKPTSTIAGRVDMSWSRPARFDFLRTIVRRGTNPGDAAPATVTGGSSVTVTGGDTGTTATVTGLVSGQTYNVSFFHAINEAGTKDGSGNLLEERYSAPFTRSVVVL